LPESKCRPACKRGINLLLLGPHESVDLRFHVIGVSHRTAPVRVREQVALIEPDLASRLEPQRAAGRFAAVLSTCNRFEIYWSGGDDLESWFRELARGHGVELDAALTRLDGEAAVRHLFSVAAGLESQILGETEILGQVRRAHQAAGAQGQEIDAVFRAAIAAGRRVRRETALGRHPASVSSAAVDVAIANRADCSSATAIVLGAGEVADGVIRRLVERGVRRVTLVNRRPDRAAALAVKWGVASRPWEAIAATLKDADLLFVTTGAKHTLVRAEDLAAVAAGRESDLVVLDLAVPRNVEPHARGLPGIRLFDLDDLQGLCCPAAGQPSIAVAEAQRILEEEVRRLEATMRARGLAPTLAGLHRLGLRLAYEETDRTLARLDSLSDVERQIVREMAERLVRRVLYPVSLSLRGGLSDEAIAGRRIA
jgi:glutamyl-tRNA reductase